MSNVSRDPWLRYLVPLLLCLLLVVIVASAWLRIARPQAGCGPWPLCRGEVVAQPAREAGSAPLAAPVRAAHRAAASLVLPVSIALLVHALRRRPRERRELHGALLLLAVVLGLALLGALAGGSRAAPVVLGNLGGGFVMLAIAWCLRTPSDDGVAVPAAVRRPARLALAAWSIQVALGALSSAAVPGYAGWVHLAWALVTGALVVRLARYARAAGLRSQAVTLRALLGAQWLLGGAAALFATPAPLVVLHNLSAAAGLAALAALCWPTRPAP